LVSIDSLLKDAMSSLPGCEPWQVKAALRETAIDFCTRTSAMTEILTISGVADQDEYTLEPEYAAFVESITTVKIDDDEIPDYAFDLSASDPATLVLTAAYTPTSAGTDNIEATLRLIPLADAEDYPDGFIARFRTAIVEGAVARLQATEKTPWSRPAEAAVHRQRYEAAVANQLIREMTGGKRSSFVLSNPDAVI
jgi:hypothetical protein